MKTLLLAVAIALVGIIAVFLALSLVGVDKTVAGPIATAIVGGIPYLRESLDKQGLPGARRKTSPVALSFDGFGLAPQRLILYGALILFATMNLASGFAGMLAGTVFLPSSDLAKPRDRVRFLSVLGVLLVVSGYILRPLHGFSKIAGTESWTLATAGICCLVFLFFYQVLDVAGLRRAASFLVPVGRNPLAAYLLPEQLNNVLVLLGAVLPINLWRVFWPFADKGGIAGMLNAAVMTALILFLTALLSRAKVTLKL
jgi:hypothetical protein